MQNVTGLSHSLITGTIKGCALIRLGTIHNMGNNYSFEEKHIKLVIFDDRAKKEKFLSWVFSLKMAHINLKNVKIFS